MADPGFPVGGGTHLIGGVPSADTTTFRKICMSKRKNRDLSWIRHCKHHLSSEPTKLNEAGNKFILCVSFKDRLNYNHLYTSLTSFSSVIRWTDTELHGICVFDATGSTVFTHSVGCTKYNLLSCS